MNQTIRIRQYYRVNVIEASPLASSSILSIAGSLGVDPQVASKRLSVLPTVLAENVLAAEARRMSALLTAFGFRVRLDPVSPVSQLVIPEGQRRDMAIQSVAVSGGRVMTDRLARMLGQSEDELEAGLAGPEGLVLRDLEDAQIVALREALRSRPNLRMVLSDPLKALYDAFATERTVPVAELSRLGLARCAVSGAVATGMNYTTAQHLARRAEHRLSIFNRDFLRFDLYLASATGPGTKELVGFLETRSRPLGLDASSGRHKVDCDLPFDVAGQFIADYQAIGLEVRARLRGLPGDASRAGNT